MSTVNYWHMQLHPDNKHWDREEYVLKEKKIIGLHEEDRDAVKFKDKIKKNDIVLIRRGISPIALVEVIGDCFNFKVDENKRDDEDLDWITLRREVKILEFYNEDTKKLLGSILNDFGTKQLVGRGTLIPCHSGATSDFVQKWHKKILEDLEKKKMIEILKQKKQIILTGAPGTGKTYLSAELAMQLINGKDYENREDLMKDYRKEVEDGRIDFTTFHQSVDYEEFVEGYKPTKDKEEKLTYKVKDGIFKKICKRAEGDKENDYILIIDEINRGNISKILGELITLLEEDKRLGKKDKPNQNQITPKLPYSNKEFGVPDNLYIIGTMNTADRSIGYIDYAIRRRFAFIPLEADENKIQNAEGKKLFKEAEKIVVENIAPDLNADDLMVGHSYFMAKDEKELKLKLEYEIKPLLLEYVKDGVLVGDDVEQQIQGLSV